MSDDTLDEIGAREKHAPQDYERAACEVLQLALSWHEDDAAMQVALTMAHVYATLAVASALVEPRTGNGVASMVREAIAARG